LKDLAGKVGVVTGGASGIGRAIAEAMIGEGMQVMIADVDRERLQATANEIGAAAQVTDVMKPGEVDALAAAAVDRFGTIHVVCNNAGIGPMAGVTELTHADWQWMLGVNLWGAVNGVTSFLPLFRANGEGHFVNTASMAGLMPVPSLVAYCASKYGVVGMSEAMVEDFAAQGLDIGVSILCPGPVRSNLGSSTRNRPAELSGALADVDLENSVQFEGQVVDWLSAEETAAQVIRAIQHNELYIITHPKMLEPVAARHRAIERAFKVEAARRVAGGAA
jgi:NAD(P)-dependent dehydrogenase (short-subunit alcohol dehydrogenase family)